jgi:hypothetical protein
MGNKPIGAWDRQLKENYEEACKYLKDRKVCMDLRQDELYRTKVENYKLKERIEELERLLTVEE